MYRYMPLTLLVDEISPDKIRATVSHPGSITANCLAFIKLGLMPAPVKDKTIGGIFILPAGKYVCIVVTATHPQRMADGMIFLDLTNREDLIPEIGEKFRNPALEKKFLQTVDHIFANPDTHSRFLLAINKHDFFST
ncbi:MAG TPA: hypothetical protein VGS79_02300 [Puia sp.]|nr:hypothetical protein [Puia sp.]